ncbi:hypothetical protein [Luteipulveratus halotolerans]|uniref:hypothetical protein n=1 Tax=Luteipulveratus halotolerans TaxID=1631356 RepID=UPI0012F7D47E
MISLGTANAFIAGVSRLAHSLAASGWLPRPVAVINRDGVPTGGIVAVSGIAAAGHRDPGHDPIHSGGRGVPGRRRISSAASTWVGPGFRKFHPGDRRFGPPDGDSARTDPRASHRDRVGLSGCAAGPNP